MSEFFVSYARSDGKIFALSLHDAIEKDGFDVWLDIHDIKPGVSWDGSVESNIRACLALLFVITPGSITSETCKDEISLALNLGKPVIPLKIIPTKEDGTKLSPVTNIDLPLRIQRRQYIDFTNTFEAGISELRLQLQQIRHITKDLETLRQQKSELEKLRDKTSSQIRVDTRISELDDQITARHRVLFEPQSVISENRRAISVGIESELQSRAKDEEQNRALNRQRIIGSAPLGINDIFKDRSDEASTITNYLLDTTNVRVVSIIGRGGTGKTALACKVLHQLEQDFKNVHGILYMSAAHRTDGISLENIYLGSAKILGGDVGKRLEAAWINPHLNPMAKANILFDQFVGKRCILLFDNLEDILDNNGKFTDPDLQDFVDLFLCCSHEARILITSREPFSPSDNARIHERIVPLQEGLDVRYGIELLKEFDPDGGLGLKDANKELLTEVAVKTMGFPRALEAVAGILANDPTLTLKELLSDESLFDREVIEKLVVRAQSRLDNDAKSIMQALALFGRAVPETAVSYLLEPYTSRVGISVSAVIKRLTRGRYITINRSTGRISMHPLDKEYCYKQIGEQVPQNNFGMTLIEMERRAASYYQQLRGQPANWKSIDDLLPALAEFEHLVRAGEFEKALRLLSIIDNNFLLMWGYARKITEMGELLHGKLKNEELEMRLLNTLAIAYNAIGDYRKDLEYSLTALNYWQRKGHTEWIGIMQGNVGYTYGNLGEYEKAIEFLLPGLEVARDLDIPGRQSLNLNQLGLNYEALGKAQLAKTLYEAALKVRGAYSTGIDAQRWRAVLLSHIGALEVSMSNLDSGASHYNEALEIARTIGAKLVESNFLHKLGQLHTLRGKYDQALEYHEKGLDLALQVGDRLYETYHQCAILDLETFKGNLPDIIKKVAAVLLVAKELGAPELLHHVYSVFARLHLQAGMIESALEANKLAQNFAKPKDKHINTVLQGIMFASLHVQDSDYQRDTGSVEMKRDHEELAIIAFKETIRISDELLSDTSDLYAPKYSKALALSGLAITSNNSEHIGEAIALYKNARKTCGESGILASNVLLLDLLSKVDINNTLHPIRDILL